MPLPVAPSLFAPNGTAARSPQSSAPPNAAAAPGSAFTASRQASRFQQTLDQSSKRDAAAEGPRAATRDRSDADPAGKADGAKGKTIPAKKAVGRKAKSASRRDDQPDPAEADETDPADADAAAAVGGATADQDRPDDEASTPGHAYGGGRPAPSADDPVTPAAAAEAATAAQPATTAVPGQPDSQLGDRAADATPATAAGRQATAAAAVDRRGGTRGAAAKSASVTATGATSTTPGETPPAGDAAITGLAAQAAAMTPLSAAHGPALGAGPSKQPKPAFGTAAADAVAENGASAGQQPAAAQPATATPLDGAGFFEQLSAVGEGTAGSPRAAGADGAGTDDAATLPPLGGALAASPQPPAQPASATASAPAGAPPPPDAETRFAEANHEKIVTGARAELMPNGGTMKLRLDPPELGPLQVSLHMKDGVVTASFQTSNEDAARLLSHTMSDLRSSLEAGGIAVDRLHVQQAPKDESGGGAGQQKGGTGTGTGTGAGRTFEQQQDARREQQRKDMVQRLWDRLAGKGPLDLVA